MSGNDGRQISRRRMFQVGAVTAATAVAASVDTANAAASPAVAGSLGQIGKVTAISAGTVTVQVDRGQTFAGVPLVGFPEGITPRVGDLVTVSTVMPEHGLSAFPVCGWEVGRPVLGDDGVASIDGHRAPALAGADVFDREVAVCLLGTTLPDAQVLAIRDTKS